LNQIVIADVTTLKWRALVSGLIYSPFIINAFVGSRVSASILENSTWRWGCRSLLDSTRVFIEPNPSDRWDVRHFTSDYSCPTHHHLGLWRTESQEARIGHSAPPPGYFIAFCRLRLVIYAPVGRTSAVQKVIAFAEQLDLIGLVLLGIAVTLILLPITLVSTTDKWSDGRWISRHGEEVEMITVF